MLFSLQSLWWLLFEHATVESFAYVCLGEYVWKQLILFPCVAYWQIYKVLADGTIKLIACARQIWLSI